MNWLSKYIRRRNTKKFIKRFIKNISESIIIKRWEHQDYGDNISFNSNNPDTYDIIGHLSNLRFKGGFSFNVCDLRDGDILVIISKNTN